MPKFVYGTHLRAKFCPVRDTTAGEIADNALFMQWIILAAEVYLAQARGLVDRVSIFQRKAHIYRALAKMIADPAARYSSTAISVLAAAPIAEARFGEPEIARKHCVALLHLLNAQGGPKALRALTPSAGIATRVLVSFISIGAGPAVFGEYSALLAGLTSLKDMLLAMQTCCELTPVIATTSRKSGTRKSFPVEKQDSPTTPSLAEENYHATHARAFNPDSPLYRYVRPNIDVDSLIEQRCHFATLFLFNKGLFDLRTDNEERTRFLSEMLAAVTSGQIAAEDSEKDIEPTVRMKALTVLYIIVDCTARYECGDGAMRSWEAIQTLELVQLASERGRLRITGLLSSWLTRDLVFGSSPSIAEVELSVILDEMRLEWLQRSGMG
jgi:hypothetical protein